MNNYIMLEEIKNRVNCCGKKIIKIFHVSGDNIASQI